MKLSIVVLFSDKDYTLFPHWLEVCKKNVQVEHEVIVVDNTTNGKIKYVDGIKLVRGGVNVGCFSGRRKGYEASKGEYIWYCDGDDEVLPLKKFEYTADLICFNYLIRQKNENEDHIGKDPVFTPYLATAESFYHAEWKKRCKNMVWNKFVHRDILHSIYTSLPYWEMYTSEDTLLSLFEEMTAKSIYFENKAFYRYFQYFGMSESKQENIEKFKHLFIGTKEGWALYNIVTTEQQRKDACITTEDILLNLCDYALRQNERCESFLSEYCTFLVEYFGKSMVIKMLNMYTKRYSNYKQMKKIILTITKGA